MHFFPVQVQLSDSCAPASQVFCAFDCLQKLIERKGKYLPSAFGSVFDYTISVTIGMVGSPQTGLAGDADWVIYRPESLLVGSYFHPSWTLAADHFADSFLLWRSREYVVPPLPVVAVLLEDLVGVDGHAFEKIFITRNR